MRSIVKGARDKLSIGAARHGAAQGRGGDVEMKEKGKKSPSAKRKAISQYSSN